MWRSTPASILRALHTHEPLHPAASDSKVLSPALPPLQFIMGNQLLSYAVAGVVALMTTMGIMGSSSATVKVLCFSTVITIAVFEWYFTPGARVSYLTLAMQAIMATLCSLKGLVYANAVWTVTVGLPPAGVIMSDCAPCDITAHHLALCCFEERLTFFAAVGWMVCGSRLVTRFPVRRAEVPHGNSAVVARVLLRRRARRLDGAHLDLGMPCSSHAIRARAHRAHPWWSPSGLHSSTCCTHSTFSRCL